LEVVVQTFRSAALAGLKSCATVSLRAHAVCAAISETAASDHSPPRSDKKENYDTASKSGMAFIIEEAGGMATDGSRISCPSRWRNLISVVRSTSGAVLRWKRREASRRKG